MQVIVPQMAGREQTISLTGPNDWTGPRFVLAVLLVFGMSGLMPYQANIVVIAMVPAYIVCVYISNNYRRQVARAGVVFHALSSAAVAVAAYTYFTGVCSLYWLWLLLADQATQSTVTGYVRVDVLAAVDIYTMQGPANKELHYLSLRGYRRGRATGNDDEQWQPVQGQWPAVACDVALLIALASGCHLLRARLAWLPVSVERAAFVFVTAVSLHLQMFYWQPFYFYPADLWDVRGTPLATALLSLSSFGFVRLFSATFMASHCEWVGMSQGLKGLGLLIGVSKRLNAGDEVEVPLKEVIGCHLVSHSMMLAMLTICWSTPLMNAQRFLFAFINTLYIVAAKKMYGEPRLEGKLGNNPKERCPFWPINARHASKIKQQ